ncbi:SpoIIE family protein phosphatase [Roseomonas sp. E05]|uniref:SpoIIE family protein phosphatase n=1 Tax=Roseomonas sp. E05 TaxID=3046310 RepID=UPI0024BA345D|nr:SpoIIE family protein phosphatase [Roseomonas sp. E05]MDJ0389329.1 SpoIIE family protein phosphatase [Roseomonas sp. E05]
MYAWAVEDPSGVAAARREAVTLAAGQGMGEAGLGAVALVATEMATNLVKHAGRGTLLVGAYGSLAGAAEPDEGGIELLALDRGPGMADVVACRRDGFSTAGSAGQGLGAIARQSALFEIFSRPGQGTAMLARIPRRARPGPAPAPAGQAEWGAVSVALAGQEVCGDAWGVRALPDGLEVVVADGLGHGPAAAQAATAALRCFFGLSGRGPAAMLEAMHGELRPTRGAAAAIARLQGMTVTFAGLGNIAGVVLGGGEVRRMVSMNGTLGHAARRFQDFACTLPAPPLLVLHSDGIANGWRLEDYPGLSVLHPSLIAAVLYRDFGRARDDATVLVARWGERR